MRVISRGIMEVINILNLTAEIKRTDFIYRTFAIYWLWMMILITQTNYNVKYSFKFPFHHTPDSSHS